MDKVLSKSYTLRDSKDNWLGQIVLTNDGMFASVTDYGNFSFAWRSFGVDRDFREFIIQLNEPYFATKMSTGLAYTLHGKKVDKAADLFASKILSPLQEVLKKEIEAGIGW